MKSVNSKNKDTQHVDCKEVLNINTERLPVKSHKSSYS